MPVRSVLETAWPVFPMHWLILSVPAVFTSEGFSMADKFDCLFIAGEKLNLNITQWFVATDSSL